jgi:hypothetical protein
MRVSVSLYSSRLGTKKNEEDINIMFTNRKNEGSEDENKRCIEENTVRVLKDENSFMDNGLNPSLNTNQLKGEHSDPDVVSPTNEKNI